MAVKLMDPLDPSPKTGTLGGGVSSSPIMPTGVTGTSQPAPFNLGDPDSSGPVPSSNQFGSLPTLPSSGGALGGTSSGNPTGTQTPAPSGIPIPGSLGSSGGAATTLPTGAAGTGSITPTATPLPNNQTEAISPQSPGFSQAFYTWLQGMIGKGATPYGGNLSADPAQNSLLQSLMSMLQGGSTNLAGGNTLQQMSTTGMPTDVGPAWNSMVDAMRRQIGQREANVREQFAFGGNLAGSPFANAMVDFQSQTGKDLNSILAQMQANASEAAAGRMNQSSQFLTGLGANTAQYTQGLSQDALNRQYSEFMRTQPEYSPLLSSQFGLATTYPPTIKNDQGLGVLGGLLGSLGTLAQVLNKPKPSGGGGGATGGISVGWPRPSGGSQPPSGGGSPLPQGGASSQGSYYDQSSGLTYDLSGNVIGSDTGYNGDQYVGFGDMPGSGSNPGELPWGSSDQQMLTDLMDLYSNSGIWDTGGGGGGDYWGWGG